MNADAHRNPKAKTITTSRYAHRKRIGACPPLAEYLQVMTAKKRQKKRSLLTTACSGGCARPPGSHLGRKVTTTERASSFPSGPRISTTT
jgi:hypothetical protein